MKKCITISAVAFTMIVGIIGCGSDKNKPGSVYMPDMAYSRGNETYAERDSSVFTSDPLNKGAKIYYDNNPVAGTIKRGELFPYTLRNDSTGYILSANVKNPIDSLSVSEMKEAGRLFNINCAICHGEKGAGNGPIATSGKIGGIANLTLDSYVKMADGTMFHSLTYGKNLMGSYASQLDRKQRWMLVKYIRTLQPKAATAQTTATATATDTTKTK
jgi:mono/diheme cytochrome c family protein